jgi:hypothetical protein
VVKEAKEESEGRKRRKKANEESEGRKRRKKAKEESEGRKRRKKVERAARSALDLEALIQGVAYRDRSLWHQHVYGQP